MWIETCARGLWGHAPPVKKLKKKKYISAIWCILIVPKYAIINLKSTIVRLINEQQQIIFAIFFYSINPYVHVNKQLHFIRGSKGVSLQEAQN